MSKRVEVEGPVVLTTKGDGTYTEQGEDVTWILTCYTEPREFLVTCVVCDEEIEEWDLWLCMDGGESAHRSCVVMSEQNCQGSGLSWGSGTGNPICPICHRGPGGLKVKRPIRRLGRWTGTVPVHEQRTS